MPGNDDDWHDHINRMEDDAKNSYFYEKDRKEKAERLRAAGKAVHLCPACSEVFECDGGGGGVRRVMVNDLAPGSRFMHGGFKWMKCSGVSHSDMCVNLYTGHVESLGYETKVAVLNESLS